jgi:peptide/nickel transport system permease protein
VTAALDEKSPRRRLRLNAFAWAGVVMVAFWILVALFGSALAPYGEGKLVTTLGYGPPGRLTMLGSDYIGRDILSRLLIGARLTLGLALVTTILAFVVGIVLGFTAALSRGWIDTVLSRGNDALLAFPSIILALIAITALGSSIPALIMIVGLIEATRVFRLARALAVDLSVTEFVEVARARGEGTWWIMRSEILPNTLLPLITEFGLRFTFTILVISALSFLGLGVQPPLADWGAMVRENISGLLRGSLAPLAPAAAISSLTIGVNLIVDSFVGDDATLID